jgi:thymidylate synthase
LTDTEASEGYIQLQTVLLGSELAWIVHQVQAEVAKGKITPKSIKDVAQIQNPELFDSADWRMSKKSSKEQVLTSQAYTAKEQLMLLLNAVMEIFEVNTIRKQIMTNFKELNSETTAVELASEETGDSSRVIDDDGSEVVDNTYNQLARIINQIKSDL